MPCSAQIAHDGWCSTNPAASIRVHAADDRELKEPERDRMIFVGQKYLNLNLHAPRLREVSVKFVLVRIMLLIDCSVFLCDISELFWFQPYSVLCKLHEMNA